MESTDLAASRSSCMSFFLPSMTSYFGRKPLSTSTARSFLGRSLTWPSEAFTTNCLPRYLPIVFAFAGDSTMTRDFAIEFLNRMSAYGYMLVDHSAESYHTLPRFEVYHTLTKFLPGNWRARP